MSSVLAVGWKIEVLCLSCWRSACLRKGWRNYSTGRTMEGLAFPVSERFCATLNLLLPVYPLHASRQMQNTSKVPKTVFQPCHNVISTVPVGGWIRLIVGFQPLMVISPTASWIRWCMQVYACELMRTCLVWAERSTLDSFWVPNHRFNSTGEQKSITQTSYTDSEPPSRLPNSLMPSAKLRSANLPVFTSGFFAVGDRILASRTPSGHSNHCAT